MGCVGVFSPFFSHKYPQARALFAVDRVAHSFSRGSQVLVYTMGPQSFFGSTGAKGVPLLLRVVSTLISYHASSIGENAYE